MVSETSSGDEKEANGLGVQKIMIGNFRMFFLFFFKFFFNGVVWDIEREIVILIMMN